VSPGRNNPFECQQHAKVKEPPQLHSGLSANSWLRRLSTSLQKDCVTQLLLPWSRSTKSSSDLKDAAVPDVKAHQQLDPAHGAPQQPPSHWAREPHLGRASPASGLLPQHSARCQARAALSALNRLKP